MLTIKQALDKIEAKIGKPVQLQIYRDKIDPTTRKSLGVESIVIDDSAKKAPYLRNFPIAQSYHGRALYAVALLERPTYTISHFYMLQFPGCCAFAISTGASVSEDYRRLGINTILLGLREYLAKQAGYTALIVTDVTKNTPSIKSFQNNGFTNLYTTVNVRTGNEVVLAYKRVIPGE